MYTKPVRCWVMRLLNVCSIHSNQEMVTCVHADMGDRSGCENQIIQYWYQATYFRIGGMKGTNWAINANGNFRKQ